MTVATASLGDLCDVASGGTPSRSKTEYFDGGIPWVKIGDLLQSDIQATEESVSLLGITNSAAKILPKGTVLISIFATIGRTAVLGIDAATNQAIAGLTPRDSGKLDSSYLRRFLDSKRDYLESIARGVAQPNINLGILKSLPIPLPPLTEQRRIAAMLDQADALRAKRREALAQLDSLTQSIFIEMFGDPVTNPKGWTLSDVGTLSKLQGGLQVTTARRDLPIELPYLRVANVYRGALDLTEMKTIRVTETEMARTTLAKGDLLIVEGHGNPNEVGRSALWTGEINRCTHQNHIIRVRFDPSKILPIFACEYLNSPTGRRHLTGTGKTTSGLNTINASNVRGTPISVPPLALQETFAARIQSVEALKATHRATSQELDNLFSSLQHRAFRGEL